MKKRPRNLAHRGFKSAAPENTMAAFLAAKQAGADGIELDVQMTKDGHLVIIHDETIDRTTDGSGWIKDMTYSELLHYDAGSWFDSRFHGEKIPLLAEVLKLAEEKGLFLNIELKTGKIPYPCIEEKTILQLNDFNLRKQVIISSFNHKSLQKIKQIDSSFAIGLLYDSPLVQPWNYAKMMGAAALHPSFHLVTEVLMQECHKHQIQVNPYTINHVTDLQRMVELEVDSIITNYPDRLKRLLESKHAI